MAGPDQRVELAPGAALGPFRLEGKLAKGGMAEIWTAEGHQGRVALKILLPQFVQDATFRAMFADEVAIASRLSHENIVEVYGAYEAGGHLFLAMELLEGRDLRRILSLVAQHSATFPVPLALAIARNVAAGLAHAHELSNEHGVPMEIVHRDVSPHNVVITREGGVKLLDFGIARAAERLTRTRTGVIKGKIAYMAPEQALAVGVTPQTDIFATGVVLWEMLAMRRLFRAPSEAETLELVVRADVPPIRALNAEVPDAAAELLHRMLALRAPDRPASMRDVVARLDRILAEDLGGAPSDAAALAEWVKGHVEEERVDTVALDITEPNPAPPDMDEVEEEAPSLEPAEDSSSPTEALAAINVPTMQIRVPSVEVSPVTPVASSAPTPTDDAPRAPGKVRLPTQSEIIRAVDQQATVPVRADPRMLERLPEVQVMSPEPESLPPPSESGPTLEPMFEPTLGGRLASADDDDDVPGAFVPLEAAPIPPEPAEAHGYVDPPDDAEGSAWWMPLVTALLFGVVIVLLVLVIMRSFVS